MNKRERSKVLRSFQMLILSLLMLTLLSPLVSAGWVDLGYSGSWTQHTRNVWEAVSGQNGGEMDWQFLNTSGFTGYHAVYNFSVLVNYAKWWYVQSVKAVKVMWNFSNVFVYMSCEDVKNWGGLMDNNWLYAGSSLNNSGFSASWWEFWCTHEVRSHVNFAQGDVFHLYIWKVDVTHVGVKVLAQRLLSDVLLWNTTHVVGAGWWDTVDISMHIWHDGEGRFVGVFSDTIYTTEYSPSVSGIGGDDTWYNNVFGNFFSIFSKVLPSWVTEMLGGFGSWLSTMFPLIPVLIGVVVQFLPYTSLILVFYVLDAGITSINQGSFTPIGVCFATLWGLASGVVSAVVGIASAVWSFIHFW